MGNKEDGEERNRTPEIPIPHIKGLDFYLGILYIDHVRHINKSKEIKTAVSSLSSAHSGQVSHQTKAAVFLFSWRIYE